VQAGLEEGLLPHTEIISSSEYESETETSMGSALPLYTSSPPSPPPLSSSSSPIDSPPNYNMSQNNLHNIIQQQQEQMAAIQAQIQALLAAVGGEAGGAGEAATETNAETHIEVAKLAIFNGEAGRVGGFVSACKIYIRNKLREETVEGQVQWALSYVQGRSADIWKENLMEELENGEMEYESIEEFFTSLKVEYRN